MLQLFGLDEDGRIALHVWFDIEDIDAAVAELDAAHARFEELHALDARDSKTRQTECSTATSHTSPAVIGTRWRSCWPTTSRPTIVAAW